MLNYNNNNNNNNNTDNMNNNNVSYPSAFHEGSKFSRGPPQTASPRGALNFDDVDVTGRSSLHHQHRAHDVGGIDYHSAYDRRGTSSLPRRGPEMATNNVVAGLGHGTSGPDHVTSSFSRYSAREAVLTRAVEAADDLRWSSRKLLTDVQKNFSQSLIDLDLY